jgi:hypothetical protein
MPDPNDNDDKKVKELIDRATRADLERWFGLPSYEALADQGIHPEPPAQDPEIAERRKRQEAALAAVDPGLLEAHHRRTEGLADAIKPPPDITLLVDPGIARLDMAMIEQCGSIAEPREIERPLDLEDALRERTPQALLRDLHRPELDFYKGFQRVDLVEEYRVDVAANIAEIMATSTRLPAREPSPFEQGHALLLELRAERRQPWIHIEMPLRRVTE